MSVGVNRSRGVLHRGQTSEASGRPTISLIRAASSAEYVVGVSRLDMDSHLLPELLPQSNELDRLRLMAKGRLDPATWRRWGEGDSAVLVARRTIDPVVAPHAPHGPYSPLRCIFVGSRQPVSCRTTQPCGVQDTRHLISPLPEVWV